MQNLTGGVFDRAYRAANGELAWCREDVQDALAAIADADLATLGGEIWLVIDDKICGMIPSASKQPPFVWPWDTKPRNETECWSDYCHRTATESLRTLNGMDVESQCRKDVRDYIRFNITFVGSDDIF